MKTTLHPQLLAALAISAGIFILQTRGYAGTPQAGGAPAFQAPEIVAINPVQAVVANRDPFVAALDETTPLHDQPPVAAVESVLTESNKRVPPADAKSGLHLRAVVLGTRRYALMADGTASRIVTVGSQLAGSSVKDISLGGIVLANGARFIPEEASAK